MPAAKTAPTEIDELRDAVAAAIGHPDSGVQNIGKQMLTASEYLAESEAEVKNRTAIVDALQQTFERIGAALLAGRDELDRIHARQIEAIVSGSDAPSDFEADGPLLNRQAARGVAQGQTAQRLADERRLLKIAECDNRRHRAEWWSRYADLATWTAMVAAKGAVTWTGAFTITPSPDSRAGHARKQAERCFDRYRTMKSELRLP